MSNRECDSVCKECGEEFVSEPCFEDFCSQKCEDAYDTRKWLYVNKECEHCGDWFHIHQSSAYNNLKYCCRECETDKEDKFKALNEDIRRDLDYDHSMDY